MKLINRLLPFLIVAAFLAVPAFAQQGSLKGTVLDKDGKPAVGYTVSIDRQGVTGHFEVKTDNKGSYFHAGLPTGQYNITIEKDGAKLAMNSARVTFGGTVDSSFDLSKATAPAGMSEEEKTKADEAKKKADETKAAFQNGLAALQAKQYDEAAKLFKQAADADPTQHVIFANLGEALAGGKKWDDAIAAYNKAIELKPDEFGYYNNLGIAQGNAGKVDDAIKTLTKAGEINPPQASQAFYNLGAVLTNKGRSKDAAEAFKKVIELKPDYAQAYLQLGISYIGSPTTMGDAVPVLEKFLTMPGISATDKDTANQLLAAAKASGAPATYKSDAQIAKEKADADKAAKDAAKAKNKKP
jgi:tetratricopeptide (TPR) repeat protein